MSTMRHITKQKFGTILADISLSPDDSFLEQAERIADALNAAGYGIVKLIEPLSPEREARPSVVDITEELARKLHHARSAPPGTDGEDQKR